MFRAGSDQWNEPKPLDDTSPVSVPVWKRFLNGQTECELHNTVFQSGLAQIAYGMWELEPKYDAAKKRLFPHANNWVTGGCVAIDDVEVVEVDCCLQCRDAERLWHK